MTGWTDALGTTQVISNTAGRTASGVGVSYWNATTFGPNCEAYAFIPSVPGNTEQVSIGVRFDAVSVNGYQVTANKDADTDQILLQRIDGGSSTTIHTTNQEFSAGHGVGIRAVGNQISYYYYNGSVWALLGTVTDSSYSGAGYIYLLIENATARVDNFSGGSVNAQLAIADSLHAHTAAGLSLTQTHTLAIADALHQHTADEVDVSVAGVLDVADSLHQHTADEVDVSNAVSMEIADAQHTQAADGLMLTVSNAVSMEIADAQHTQAADGLMLTQTHTLAIANCIHTHTADGLLFAALVALTTLTLRPRTFALTLKTRSFDLTISDRS